MTREQVEAALEAFRGDFLQMPPIYGHFGVILAMVLSSFTYVFLFVQGALTAVDPHGGLRPRPGCLRGLARRAFVEPPATPEVRYRHRGAWCATPPRLAPGRENRCERTSRIARAQRAILFHPADRMAARGGYERPRPARYRGLARWHG